MQYIPKNLKIKLEWQVMKGIGNVEEDFSRSRVYLFLVSDKDRWSIPCTATNKVTAELPETLEEGVYHLELVWYKNENTIEALRSVQRTRKSCVFCVDAATPSQGSSAILKVQTIASTYGYDGLSAYEIAVMRGKTSASEDEWAKGLFDDVLANLLHANIAEIAEAKMRVTVLEDEVKRLWEALEDAGGTIPPIEIPLPTQGASLTYNKNMQTYVCGNWEELSARGIKVANNTGTAAGEYVAKYTLPEDTEAAQYKWAGVDAVTRDIEVAWSIAKKKAKITVSIPNKSIYNGDALTFSGSVDNGGVVRFYHSGNEVFTGQLYPNQSFDLRAVATGGDLNNYIAADDVVTRITVSEKVASPMVGYISESNIEGLAAEFGYGDNFNLLEAEHFELDMPEYGLPISFEEFNAPTTTKDGIVLLRNAKGIKDLVGTPFPPFAESSSLKIYQIGVGSTIELIK